MDSFRRPDNWAHEKKSFIMSFWFYAANVKISKLIVSKVPSSFFTHEEPCYRSALRMRFGDISIPAAIGGPLSSWPNMPEGINIARVQIFLESWATAQSGEVIELAELSPLIDMAQNKKNQNDRL